MAKDLRTKLLDCLKIMLRPIVRFCIIKSISIQDFIELLKQLYVETAAQELKSTKEKITTSRISVMTGLQRRAVDRIYREEESKESISITTRVTGQWRADERFSTKNHRPKVLTFKGKNNQFSQLVYSVSKELRPKTVLYDLERLGVIEYKDGGIKLKRAAYQPQNDSVDAFKLIARNTHDSLMASLENVLAKQDDLPNFHATSVYDNVAIDDIPEVREWFLKECDKFHTKVEKYLSKKDLDITPRKGVKGGKRVVYGSFTRTY